MRRAKRVIMLIGEARGEFVSPSQLVSLERELNKIWNQYGAYFTITGRHFLDQIERPDHWVQPITYEEVGNILYAFSLGYARNLSVAPLAPLQGVKRGVIRNDLAKINIGFVVDPVSKKGFNRDVELTTILRKDRFFTQDPLYKTR